jgi:hypothetical protein
VVVVTLRHRGPRGWSKPFTTLAVVDTALSICTAPPDVAQQIGFSPPLMGPRRRIETGSGAVDYWMGEVELRIDRQKAVLRPHVGFGGTRRSMHLGYAQVLQHFRADFRPYEGAFSLTRVPPAKPRTRP